MKTNSDVPYDDLPANHADWFSDNPHARSSAQTVLDQFQVLPDGETHPLDDLRDLIGDYRTLAFWRWADVHGKRHGRSWRRQVYIPKPNRLKPSDTLVKEVGRDAARLICEHFGGATIDLPSARSTERRAAQRYARILSSEHGLSPRKIADEVSQSGYPISAYQVREWLKSDSEG